MRKMPDEFIFHEGDIPGLDSREAAQLTFELQNILEHLELGSSEYIKTAKAFRAEKLRKPLPSDRPTNLG
jgi:hypothetical protein